VVSLSLDVRRETHRGGIGLTGENECAEKESMHSTLVRTELFVAEDKKERS